MELITQKALSSLSSALPPVIQALRTAYLGGDVTPEEMNYLERFSPFEISELTERVKSKNSDELKTLLQDLQEAALLVDDVLDLYYYNQIKKQVSSSSTGFINKLKLKLKEILPCILPKSSLRDNLENVLKFVEQVKEKHPTNKSDKTEDQRTQNIPKETTSTLSSPYFGREEQRETIVKLLLDARAESERGKNEVSVIAIKGMGGYGKTLTAQHVCKNEKITNYFGKPMWVHVGTDFDVKKLTKKIIESINDGSCPQSYTLEELQKSLKESLKKRKRFLLVLDDVWCEDVMEWDLLISPLNEAKRDGSKIIKIIITTRVDKVASERAGKKSVIDLNELKDEDCWSILNYYAFDGSKHVTEDPELRNVGNQIIRKARSSPLALKVVGSQLRDTNDIDEWEKMLKRDILKETRDLLSFSFQRLPSHLKPCFAYCSLFPKGYIYKEHLLVSLWIAQGYIKRDKNDGLTLEEEKRKKTLEAKGSMYIDDLISLSFFEKDSNNELIIHDLLNDLAKSASADLGSLCHRIEKAESPTNIPKNCIHLSIMGDGINISDMSTLKKLRSLIILNDASYTNIFIGNTDISEILFKLRALYVKFDSGNVVLNNPHIDQLKHLRYLRLQYDTMLPESLTKLYHLQFFDLLYTPRCVASDDRSYLMSNILPQGFGNLISLHSLKFLNFYEEMGYIRHSKPYNIDILYSQENIPEFCPEKNNPNGMVPLGNLPLGGSLRVCSLENVKSKGNAKKAKLEKKQNLSMLILEWESSTAGGTCEEVLEGLEPHEKLKSLMIKGYEGVKIPNWMEERSWGRSLRSLTLLHCKGVTEINFLPPSLQDLHVERCPKLKKLPRFGNTLSYLNLILCPVLRLESMPNNSSCLALLKVQRCPLLMTDEPSLLVKKVAERGTTNGFSQAKRIELDEPLLLLLLVQQHGFSSTEQLYLSCTEAKPFPPVLEDHFQEFSSLCYLAFKGSFTTLPNLEKLSSLRRLYLEECPNVELLPNLPTSLKEINGVECPKLYVNYNDEDGPLYETVYPRILFNGSHSRIINCFGYEPFRLSIFEPYTDCTQGNQKDEPLTVGEAASEFTWGQNN